MNSRFSGVQAIVRAETVVERHRRLEAELAARLLGAPEAEDRVIPRTARRDLELRARAAQLDDQLGELADRRLDAAREVVDVARRAALARRRAGRATTSST